MALPIDVNDPGNSNVESQAFGLGIPANITPGSVVANQFASASAINLGFARVGAKPNEAEPFRLGIPVDVDTGDDVAEQAVAATPLLSVPGGNFKPGLGAPTDANDPGMFNAEAGPVIGLGLPPLVSGDASRPGRGAPTDTTQNNIAGQVYGTGTPRNVNV